MEEVAGGAQQRMAAVCGLFCGLLLSVSALLLHDVEREC